MRSRVNRREIRAAICVVAEICQKCLLNSIGDAEQFVGSLLDEINVCRIRAGGTGSARTCCRKIRKPYETVVLVEANDRSNDIAAEEAATVVVDVEAEIDSGAKGMGSRIHVMLSTTCGAVIPRWVCGERQNGGSTFSIDPSTQSSPI